MDAPARSFFRRRLLPPPLLAATLLGTGRSTSKAWRQRTGSRTTAAVRNRWGRRRSSVAATDRAAAGSSGAARDGAAARRNKAAAGSTGLRGIERALAESTVSFACRTRHTSTVAAGGGKAGLELTSVSAREDAAEGVERVKSQRRWLGTMTHEALHGMAGHATVR
ncbi:hypothetical protein ACP70R_035133 [Stipagrostis hirtigluma subsp. patula]